LTLRRAMNRPVCKTGDVHIGGYGGQALDKGRLPNVTHGRPDTWRPSAGSPNRSGLRAVPLPQAVARRSILGACSPMHEDIRAAKREPWDGGTSCLAVAPGESSVGSGTDAPAHAMLRSVVGATSSSGARGRVTSWESGGCRTPRAVSLADGVSR